MSVKTNGETLSPAAIIERKDFAALFSSLQKCGYTIVGPTIREDAIVYNTITESSQLPVGWSDEQESGKYRLIKRNIPTFFGFNSTPQSWKRFLHPPIQQLWQLNRIGKQVTFTRKERKNEKLALLGVRACDLQAIKILDKVFTESPRTDSNYQRQRQNIFIITVNCNRAGATCFCSSMNTGPKAENGFDLSLTEICNNSNHYFFIEIGSQQGAKILKDIPHRQATVDERNATDRLLDNMNASIRRTVDVNDIKNILYRNSESKRWNEIAKRCLTCANCTMVCPTCFCTTIEDVTDLTGKQAERLQKWDSCFTSDFSYIHGGSIRPSVYARYRQWLTHKFASWQDQFGTSGCVGCGRCITWCPVGIDVTEELTAIRSNELNNPSNNLSKEKNDGNS